MSVVDDQIDDDWLDNLLDHLHLHDHYSCDYHVILGHDGYLGYCVEYYLVRMIDLLLRRLDRSHVYDRYRSLF